MTYNSPFFVFFVAFGLFAYGVLPERFRRRLLLAMSLIWYGSWHPAWPLLLTALVWLNCALLKLGRKAVPGVVVLDIAVLVTLKALPYFPVPDAIRQVVGTQTLFGASFIIFLLVSYVIDFGRSKAELPDFPGALLYVSFFPALLSGPIERYGRLAPQFAKLGPIELVNLADGACLFAYGFLKKTYLGDPLAMPALSLLESSSGIGSLLLGGLVSTFQTYVDFSSYCDMGRGAARCFGIRLQSNFLPFYFSRNPSEFWQRWNVTLGTWIRDYLTLPAMLRFGRSINRYGIILIAFTVVGLWHGLAIHWILFGLVDGGLIVLFFALQNGPLLRRPRAAVAAGIVLAVALWISNGILQHPESLGLIRAAGSAPLGGNTLGIFLSRIVGLGPAICAILIADFIQEKKGGQDFFLTGPVIGRIVAGGLFLAWLAFKLKDGEFISLQTPPPFYFRF